MKSKSFRYLIGLFIIFVYSPLLSDEKIDIWKSNKERVSESQNQENQDIKKTLNPKSSQTIQTLDKIQIEESATIQQNPEKVYGIYEPANYDFSLNMWSSTKAEDLRSSLKRIDNINLSKSSSEILSNFISFSYPPQDMNEKEFVDLKINWLIENDRIKLIGSFLKQNEQFDSKSKAVQYLVDTNIASGNIRKV